MVPRRRPPFEGWRLGQRLFSPSLEGRRDALFSLWGEMKMTMTGAVSGNVMEPVL